MLALCFPNIHASNHIRMNTGNVYVPAELPLCPTDTCVPRFGKYVGVRALGEGPSPLLCCSLAL